MSVDPITGDGTVDAVEKWNGFQITGNTGTSSGAVVSVTVNGTHVGNATSAILSPATLATWSVSVQGDRSYITTASNQPVVATSPHIDTALPDVSHERKFDADLTLPLSVDAVTGDNIINDGILNIEGKTGDDTGHVDFVQITWTVGTQSSTQ